MPVKLCMTGLVSKGGEPIGKVLGFSCSARAFILALECFSTCQCAQHAPMNQTCWTETGFYTPKLAEAIVRGAVEALK